MRDIPLVAKARRVTSGQIRRFMLKAAIITAMSLIFSMGGAAIFAAPVTAPLMIYVISRDELGRRWRIAAALILALTLAECAWAVAYITVGESSPAIWLAPVVVLALFATAGTVFLLRRIRVHRYGPRMPSGSD